MAAAGYASTKQRAPTRELTKGTKRGRRLQEERALQHPQPAWEGRAGRARRGIRHPGRVSRAEDRGLHAAARQIGRSAPPGRARGAAAPSAHRTQGPGHPRQGRAGCGWQLRGQGPPSAKAPPKSRQGAPRSPDPGPAILRGLPPAARPAPLRVLGAPARFLCCGRRPRFGGAHAATPGCGGRSPYPGAGTAAD